MRARPRPIWPVNPLMLFITVAVCGFLVVLSVLYTLHRNRNGRLQDAIVRVERELREVTLTNQLLDARIKTLRSQAAIERQVHRLQLPLKPTRHEQVLLLADPLEAAPVAPMAWSSVELAGRPAGP
jgi:hypothetical protein